MKKTYLKSFCARCLTLLVLALLSTNLAWGEEVTMAYSGSTTNMTGENDAATVGLDATSWSVVAGKGGNNNFPGLNKAGQIRLYGSSSNHNIITVTNSGGNNISSIKVTYGSSNYNAKVSVGDNEVTGTGSNTEKTYTINSTSFSIAHNYTSTTQVYIISIVITYGSTTPSKTLTSIAISGTPTKTTYEAGENFDPAGLVVKGTYDDKSEETITSGITWNVTPNPLTAGTTSVSVTAKVGDITSAAYQVNGLTVTARTYKTTYTSGVALSSTGGTSASDAEVIINNEGYTAIKAGTNSVMGAVKITVPANTKTLHFHAVGWKGENVELTATQTISENDITLGSFTLSSDDGIANNSPFTLSGEAVNYYYTLDTYNSETITITISVTKGKRFVLFGVNAEGLETIDVAITDISYATAYIPFASTVEGATAYYVTIEDDKAVLNKITGTIPANTGVVLNGDKGIATFTESAEAPTSVEGNKLIGYTEDKTVDNGKAHYALSHKNEVVGFYIPSSCVKDDDATASFTATAYKAYLELDAPVNAGKLEISFDEPTGIEEVQGSKFNFQGSAYNLNGVRVNERYKGIVIMNGKKYMNK